MEEGKILLIDNETDILHCGFSFPLSEGGKRYPSAYHYAHSMILTQLGLDEVHILELLATSSAQVATKARELLQENMPAGHDMNSLAHYLTTSRQSYTMAGLRLRAEQDKRFRQALMETNEALLIVCDRRDSELGIGMDDEAFVTFTRRMHADAEVISQWMRDERTRPAEIGQNQLGFFLMWLRFEIKEKERVQWMTTNDVKAQGLSTDQDDQPIQISVSDFIVALQGIFQPLSNYYAASFEIKGEIYRSVEHYAYQRLFEALKLSEADVMRVRTTVKPVDVAKFARRTFKRLKLDEAELEQKMTKLDRWRQSAMKHKISKNELLQQLLLSTGHAILIETAADADPQWSICTDEFELQHLLTKRYVTPQVLIDWMCGRMKRPISMSHLGGNKTGLLLMELRTKFAVGCTHRIPLVSPLENNVIRTSVSNYMICFTPESVLHPFYSCEVKPAPDAPALPSPIHYVAQTALKFFNACAEDSVWVMDTPLGPDCWSRLHYVITEQLMPPLDKIQQWYMTERQNAFKYAMRLQFEQNPQLLRILLDTGDALLVACSRFSSTEAELTIGMRERDLRLWLANVRVDSKNMIDLCLRPMAFRPPFLGGNRIGIMLMEIRRDFILKGVFPQQLPELAISVDAMLGSESPMENYVPHYTFNILNEQNYSAVWANAFLLMAKQDGMEPYMWVKANSKKTAPTLLSIDEVAIDCVMEEFRKHFDSNAPKSNYQNRIKDGNNIMDDIKSFELDENGALAENDDDGGGTPTIEVLRAVFAKLAASFREKMIDDENVQREISNKSKENSRMQEMRRAIERTRDQALNKSDAAVTSTSTITTTTTTVKMEQKFVDKQPQQQWTPVASSSSSSPNTSGRASHRALASPRNRNGGVAASNVSTSEASRPRPHNQLDPFASLASLSGNDKIPSLLSDFSAAAAAATAAAGATGISPAAAAILEKNFEKELQKILPKLAASSASFNPNSNSIDQSNRRPLLPHYRNAYDGTRGGGRAGYGGGGVGGRRGGRSGGNERSPSPMTAYFHQQNRQPQPYHQQQQHLRPPLQQQQQHHAPTQGTPLISNSGNIKTPATVAFAKEVEKPPQPKKPRRIVDESELSEGEILSDEDE